MTPCPALRCAALRRRRYRRQQLVQLRQEDGKLFWVRLKELAGNCHSLLLCHGPASYAHCAQAGRLDPATPPRPQLLHISSPEPISLLCSVAAGPQHALLPLGDPPTRKVRHLPTGCGSPGARGNGTETIGPKCLGLPVDCMP